jgi:hypothetical protein
MRSVLSYTLLRHPFHRQLSLTVGGDQRNLTIGVRQSHDVPGVAHRMFARAHLSVPGGQVGLSPDTEGSAVHAVTTLDLDLSLCC